MVSNSYYMDYLRDAVDELTLPHNVIVKEPYWDSMRHRKFRATTIAHRPLLVDLALAVVPRGGVSEGGRPAFGSRPPIRIEAVDELARIKTGVLGWCDVLDLQSRFAIAQDLRMLVGVGLTLSELTLERLSRDARGWAMGARIVTGWEEPVFMPRASCPHCGMLSSLRIYPAQRVGRCVTCGVTWSDSGADGGFGVLVEHVRLEGELAG